MRAFLTQLWLGQLPLPGKETYVRPAGDTSPKYFEWLERHTDVVYPVLGAVALAAVVIGILQAWRAPSVDGAAKLELKREVMISLHRELGGMSVEVLAQRLGVDRFKLVRLLEEMEADGMVRSHTQTDRRTLWQVRGSRS